MHHHMPKTCTTTILERASDHSVLLRDKNAQCQLDEIKQLGSSALLSTRLGSMLPIRRLSPSVLSLQKTEQVVIRPFVVQGGRAMRTGRPEAALVLTNPERTTLISLANRPLTRPTWRGALCWSCSVATVWPATSSRGNCTREIKRSVTGAPGLCATGSTDSTTSRALGRWRPRPRVVGLPRAGRRRVASRPPSDQ